MCFRNHLFSIILFFALNKLSHLLQFFLPTQSFTFSFSSFSVGRGETCTQAEEKEMSLNIVSGKITSSETHNMAAVFP